MYLSTVANRQGEVNKRLTIIATIFLPLTFLTGFFGQNFSFLTDHLLEHDLVVHRVRVGATVRLDPRICHLLPAQALDVRRRRTPLPPPIVEETAPRPYHDAEPVYALAGRSDPARSSSVSRAITSR